MQRLTFLLCVGIFAALLIAGEDRGQMRPGLALALAESRRPVVEPAESLVVAKPAPAAVELAVAAPAPKTEETRVVARAEPEPYVEPLREVVQQLEEPVFTLSALPTEEVPGASDVPAPTKPEVANDATGQIWYVTASSVNVRVKPSTDSEVLGTLALGEAALVVTDVDGEWARIVIQGDGMEGFVALRYLSPEAP
ncbi:MAG: peptide-binding protein [Rhodobacter sp.]|nr:peptide-binding protein [Rhodobacter sp.]